MDERRNNPRLLCADLVHVRWRDESGKPCKGVANLEDISLQGACLQMELGIPRETVMRITHPKGELVGIVRYCEYRDFGYFVGLEFEAGTKWSLQEFRPQHLLDPRRLVARKGEDQPQSEQFSIFPPVNFAL